MAVYVRLFGNPAIRYDREWLEPPVGLPSALLYYLAHKTLWVPREELAFLFWSDIPEANARRNLRNLVLRVKELNYTQNLEIERSRLRWQVDTDVSEFSNALKNNQLDIAINLVSGELLQGFRIDGAVEFEGWLEAEREALKQSWHKAIFSEVADLESQGNAEEAVNVLDALLKADPGHEEALQAQLHLLDTSGQHSVALHQFERFKTYLETELGGEPAAKTSELVAQIRASSTTQTSVAPKLTIRAETPIPRHNLPAQLTFFVGRDAERARIAEQLADPSCRLLTLVGPGGIGKTRLALAAAQEQLELFHDGVYFVALAAVHVPEQIVYTIADAIDLSLSGQQEPREQLLAHLKDKELLLVLDNFEHLLSGAAFITEMLGAAPGLKVLATSRELLNLKAEWLIDLRGLSYPSGDSVDKLERFDAINLFVQSAKRLQPDFALEENTPAVIRICQLVAGMPLALELASGWLRLLTPSEIVMELAQGLDLLESSTRDMPERHQSIRSVFDTSWEFLTRAEREVLGKLAIFRGGFLREAAGSVAGASLPTLANLVHKSFLTRTASGRYERHPLVYQYTYEKLKERQDYSQVQEKHRLFYTGALQRWGQALSSGRQTEILHLLEAELANIRAAFHWAVRAKKVAELHHAFSDLELYFVQANRFREGLELFEVSLTGLESSNPNDQLAKGKVLVSQAHFYYRLGQFDKVAEVAQQGIELLKSVDNKLGLMNGYNKLGITAIQTGDYLEAKRHLEEALSLARSEGLEQKIANYTNNLGLAVTELGSFDQAEQLYREALETNQRLSNFLSKVRNLNNLGDLALLRENYQDAHDFFKTGLSLAKEMDFQQPLPHLLNGLASSTLGLKDYVQAEALAKEAEEVAHTSGERSIQVEALENLGKVMLALDNLEASQTYFIKALEAAWHINGLKFVLPLLLHIAILNVKQNHPDSALRYAKLVLRHPAANEATKVKAEHLLSQLQNEDKAEIQVNAGKNEESLEDLVEAVLSARLRA